MMKRRDEQELAAVCHLCNIIPAWGLIFSAAVWMKFQERSLFLKAQVRQAMLFHALLLAVLFLWIIVDVLARILRHLIPLLGDLLHGINVLILVTVLVLYVAFCIRAAWKCLAGESYRYPVVGDRLG